MEISAKEVKQLREETGVSMMACKKALIEAKGNIEEAKKILKRQGVKVAETKVARVTHQGRIEAYIHSNSKIGTLIEVHCETDFVAKNTDFQKLCKELALQIVGYNPLYISPDYIPAEDLKKQQKLFEDDYKSQGLTGERLKKAVEGRLEKFTQENSLLSQPYFRDTSKTVQDMVTETIARLGENIQVKNFTRYQID